VFKSRLLTLVTLLAAFALPAAAATAPAKPPVAQVNGDGMSLGSPKAKVQVDEYASLSCVHCAHFNNTVFPAFKAKYVDTGKVRYTLHEILTDPTQLAAAGFMLARCSGPANYFTVIDGVFQKHDEMFAGGDIRAILLGVAKTAGLNETQFDACLNDKAGLTALNARVEREAKAGDVEGTPTFLINGKKAASGVMTLADLDKAIAEAGKGKK
jgi:protein-disulfide isomerase